MAAAVGLWLPAAASAQSYPPSVIRLVADAKKQVRTIDMARFRSGLDDNQLGLLFDVREPGEFAAGYVPGAINLPRGLIELRIWQYVGYPQHTDLARKMTLYCGTGVRCILAAKSLQDLGFTNVTAVDMRIDEWGKAGNPLLVK